MLRYFERFNIQGQNFRESVVWNIDKSLGAATLINWLHADSQKTTDADTWTVYCIINPVEL